MLFFLVTEEIKNLSLQEKLDYFTEYLESIGFSEDGNGGESTSIDKFFTKEILNKNKLICHVRVEKILNSKIGNFVFLSMQQHGFRRSARLIRQIPTTIAMNFNSELPCIKSASVCLKYIIDDFYTILSKIIPDSTLTFRPRYRMDSIEFESYGNSLIEYSYIYINEISGIVIVNKNNPET